MYVCVSCINHYLADSSECLPESCTHTVLSLSLLFDCYLPVILQHVAISSAMLLHQVPPLPIVCCGISVNYDWRKQCSVCGERLLSTSFLNWRAEGCGNPRTAPANQQLPLLCFMLCSLSHRLPAEMRRPHCTHCTSSWCFTHQHQTLSFKVLV